MTIEKTPAKLQNHYEKSESNLVRNNPEVRETKKKYYCKRALSNKALLTKKEYDKKI